MWWLDYYVRGKRHRESSHTTSQREALRLLRERTTAREQGKLVGRPELVTFAALQVLVREAYTLAGNRSLDRLDNALVHLAAFFGADRAPDITTGRLAAYATARLTTGAARASVNYELACLRRALRLAVKRGLLTTLPVFDLPKVHNTRTGFFQAATWRRSYWSYPRSCVRSCGFSTSRAGAAVRRWG